MNIFVSDMNILKEIDFGFLETLNPILYRIASKKAIIDNARPLSSGLVSRIKDDISLEWTYNSNAIEGNSLTLVETRVVIEDGMTIGGKSLREHFEVINHNSAIHYLEEIVSEDYVMRSIDILSLHELVLDNIDKINAGRIRNVRLRIMGANFTPPSPAKVSDYLDILIDFVNKNPLGLVVPVLAAVFHHQFVWIHPFSDGNGRTGRLAMNLVLQSYGYPPAIILKNDRKKYYDALNQANNGRYEKITLLVLQGLERTLNMYLDIIPDAYGDYDSLTNIAEEPAVPYGAEYLGLLARRGLINAHKEGRKWVTTKKDVLEYARNQQS